MDAKFEHFSLCEATLDKAINNPLVFFHCQTNSLGAIYKNIYKLLLLHALR